MNKHRNSFIHMLAVISTLIVFWSTPLQATQVQMNLREMCVRADKIFRGTVISAIPGTIRVGGGELPIITYRIRVDETFKGDVQTVKGVHFTEVRMLATPKRKEGEQSRKAILSLEMPELAVGQRYLLLTTRPSAIGMSSPIGLGQGCFHITGTGSDEEAVNSFGNSMLFRDMEPFTAKQANGPRSTGSRMKYSQLAEHIRRLVNEERRSR